MIAVSLKRLQVFDQFASRRRKSFKQNSDDSINKSCALSSSLVKGIFLPNTLTKYCLGGTIATLCSDKVDVFGEKLVVMGYKNNIINKQGRDLMSERVVVKERKCSSCDSKIDRAKALLCQNWEPQSLLSSSYCNTDMLRDVSHTQPEFIKQLARDYRNPFTLFWQRQKIAVFNMNFLIKSGAWPLEVFRDND